MDDLISRQAAIDAVKSISDSICEQQAIDALCELPSIDAVPVKHGRWIPIDWAEPRRYGCSECHRMVWQLENYCPSCGARMDGEDNG